MKICCSRGATCKILRDYKPVVESDKKYPIREVEEGFYKCLALKALGPKSDITCDVIAA